MAYVRFEPGFSRHPKRLKCGPEANWLWVCIVDYCFEHLTDGFLPAEAVPSLVPSFSRKKRERLIEALLSTKSLEHTPGGYQVHDYDHHQLSASEVRADREAGKRRAQAWREARRAKTQGAPPTDANGERAPNGNEVRTLNVQANERSTYGLNTHVGNSYVAERNVSERSDIETKTPDSRAPAHVAGDVPTEQRGRLQSQPGLSSEEDDLVLVAYARQKGCTIEEARQYREQVRTGVVREAGDAS